MFVGDRTIASASLAGAAAMVVCYYGADRPIAAIRPMDQSVKFCDVTNRRICQILILTLTLILEPNSSFLVHKLYHSQSEINVQ